MNSVVQNGRALAVDKSQVRFFLEKELERVRFGDEQVKQRFLSRNRWYHGKGRTSIDYCIDIGSVTDQFLGQIQFFVDEKSMVEWEERVRVHEICLGRVSQK